MDVASCWKIAQMKLSQLFKNEKQIEQALQRRVTFDGDYEITSNGVNIDGDVIIPRTANKIPVQFNIVTGDFNCANTKITSLKGSPREVDGNFNCSHTNIKSLKGAPNEVGGNFDCSYTNITSLKEGPIEVGGNFNCSLTPITSLRGAPREVGHSFVCYKTNIQGKPDTSHIDIGSDLIWEKR